MRVETNSRKLIRILEGDGWSLSGIERSHHNFIHPTKPGKLQVPHPKKDIPVGTAYRILKFAGPLKGSS